MVHIRAFADEELCQFNVVFLTRYYQRCDPRLVSRVFENRPCSSNSLAIGRLPEKAAAWRVNPPELRAMTSALAQQEFRNGKLIVESSSDEERCLVACAAVDVGTACQGLLHGTLVAGSDGVEQRLTCDYSCSRQYQHSKCQQSAHRVK